MRRQSRRIPLSQKSLYYQINNFIKNHPEWVLAPGTVQKIFNKFLSWKSFASLSSSSVNSKSGKKFEKRVIYYLIERCFWENCEDSDFVAQLLVSLYEMDGNLLKIILPERFLSKQPLKTTWTSGNLSQIIITPLMYFLSHSYRGHVLFDGRRVVESHTLDVRSLPMYDVVYHLTCPKLLLFLFRHGVFLDDGKLEFANKKKPKLVDYGELFFRMVQDIAIFSLPPNINLRDVCPNQSSFSFFLAKLSCARLVLRSVPPDFDALRDSRFVHRQLEDCFRVLEIRSERREKLMSRCCGLSELKHLCRYRIRKCLYDVWQLPQGIEELSLSPDLKDYLDLQKDW